tara:strand:+ start:1208 stop:1975 length:768 start_codon:yes stop_codon:yes gene_type:complete
MFIKKEIENHICILKVDREDALNALNPTVLKELYQAIEAAIASKNVGAIIITGSGKKAFIAGADIKLMKNLDSNGAISFGKLGQDVAAMIEHSPKPIIAAINGFALGGGCEIAIACHLRFASEDAKFAQPEVKLGLIPGWGGTQRLPRIVGKGNAIELIIGGHIIDAQEALRIGLVNKIFEKKKLLDETVKFTKLILDNGPNALALSLKAVNESSDKSLSKGLKIELEIFSELFGTKEAAEGLGAFIEKRKPRFK